MKRTSETQSNRSAQRMPGQMASKLGAWRLSTLACLAMVIASCGAPAPDTASEARIAFEDYIDALNEGDIESAVEMYDSEPGFHWIERGGIAYENGSEAAASLRSFSAESSSNEMRAEQIQVAVLAEGAALVSGYFTFAQLSEEGETLFSFDGWMTLGMVKRPEGWRIAGGQSGPGPYEDASNP